VPLRNIKNFTINSTLFGSFFVLLGEKKVISLKSKHLKEQLSQLLIRENNNGFEIIREKIDYRNIIEFNQNIRANRLAIFTKLAMIMVCLLIIFISLPRENKNDQISAYEIVHGSQITELNTYVIPSAHYIDKVIEAPNIEERIDRFIADKTYNFYEIKYFEAASQSYIVGYLKKQSYEDLISGNSINIEGIDVAFNTQIIDGLLYFAYLQNRPDLKSIVWVEFQSRNQIPSKIDDYIPIIVFCGKPVVITDLDNYQTQEMVSYFVYRFIYNTDSEYLISIQYNEKMDNIYLNRKELIGFKLTDDLRLHHVFNTINQEYFYNYIDQDNYAIPIKRFDSRYAVNVSIQSLGKYAGLWSELHSEDSCTYENEIEYLWYDALIQKIYSLREVNSSQ